MEDPIVNNANSPPRLPDEYKYNMEEIVENSLADDSEVLSYMIRVMGENPVLTEKQFLLTYVRFCVVAFLKNPPWTAKFGTFTTSPTEICEKIVDKFNIKLTIIGLRLSRVIDESTLKAGNRCRYVVLVTELSNSEVLTSASGFKKDEIFLLSIYLNQIFSSANGEISRHSAMAHARKLPNPMSAIQTQKFVDKLVNVKWFTENKEGNLTLSVRGIAELGNYLKKKYSPPLCAICNGLVVCKRWAISCKQCGEESHAVCRQEFAKAVDGTMINCPGASCAFASARSDWLECKGMAREETEIDKTTTRPSASRILTSSQNSNDPQDNVVPQVRKRPRRRVESSSSDD